MRVSLAGKEGTKVKKQEIMDKLRRIYEEVLDIVIDSADFASGEGLIEKLYIDSLLALKMLIRIEQDFTVLIEEDSLALELLDSSGAACAYIMKAQYAHE